jgi:DNA replication and repair protein RecF
VAQYSSELLHKLEASLHKDLERGFTSYGPHRDDLLVSIEDHPINESASRGEVRTILLGLKIIELQIVEEVSGQKPLLLLDDVFSELDGSRRRMLTTSMTGYQTFITTTDADVVVRHFMDNCRILPIERGTR